MRGKLGSADNRLVSEVHREVLKAQREARREKQRQAWQAKTDAHEAALQVERDRNGGMTDAEISQQAKRQAEQDNRQAMLDSNDWLVRVLESTDYPVGGFVDSMLTELGRKLARDISPRCQEILRQIFAKTYGRTGSKKYNAACERYDEIANAE